MSSHFHFTVPDSKEKLNSEIKKLAISNAEGIEIVNTKDGTVYMLEFNSDIKKQNFEVELNEKFPFLFY